MKERRWKIWRNKEKTRTTEYNREKKNKDEKEDDKSAGL